MLLTKEEIQEKFREKNSDTIDKGEIAEDDYAEFLEEEIIELSERLQNVLMQQPYNVGSQSGFLDERGNTIPGTGLKGPQG